jgi:hypothetical protein
LSWLIVLAAGALAVVELPMVAQAVVVDAEIGFCFFLKICQALLLLLWHQQQVQPQPIQQVLQVEPLVLALISMVTEELAAAEVLLVQVAVEAEQPLLVL